MKLWMEENEIEERTVGLIMQHISVTLRLALHLIVAGSTRGLWETVQDYRSGKDDLTRGVV